MIASTRQSSSLSRDDACAEMKFVKGDYVLTDDKSVLDLTRICSLLNSTYWAANRPRELIEKSIQQSLCFGLFHSGQQAGFARAVTDYATFAWICDVIVAPEHRGRGLGKWMVECVLAHPELQTTTQVLRTRDAHTLYERFGFERIEYLRRSTVNDPSKSSSADRPARH
jgi:GNAT superfamily N-acetyltransferase